MSEEMGIKEQKLNLIDRLKKQWITRKIKRTEDFDVYLKIKDSKVKYDRELMELAWEFANKSDISEFTPVFQKEKAKFDNSILKFCDESIQKEFVEQSSLAIGYCSEMVQMDIAKENPEEIKRCNEKIQRSLTIQDNKLLSYCRPEMQKQMLADDPKLILYCDQEIKKEVLDDAEPKSLEWQTIIEDSDWQTLKNMTAGQNYMKRRDIKVKWLNQSEQKVEDVIGMMDILDRSCIRYLKNDRQQQFFEHRNLLEEYLIEGNGANEKCLTRKSEMLFGKDCIGENFRQKYGQEKYVQYEPLLEDLYSEPSKYPEETKRRILNMFFREETIVQKVEPQKIKQYFDEEDNKKKLFREIIGEAYGKEALKILEEREGLDLENVDNTEVFLPQVLHNFREGFVQDLLSYDFERIDDFIKIVKSPEDLKAFKFYYDRMSNNLGENAVTMQMCMERYGEYSDILKEASEVKLDDEQITRLEQLCSWRRNIAGIKKIEELPQLEEKMQKALLEQEQDSKARGEANYIPVNKRLFGDDILLKEIGNEAAIYDLYNLTGVDMQELTESEREAMQLLQSGFYTDTHIGMDELLKAINENIPVAPIFLDTYKAINKVKENDMEKFREEVTDREKIEAAIREGKYDVKKLVVDGVEVIDLGKMKTNFAIHTIFRNGGNAYLGLDKNIPQVKEYVTYDKRKGISTISARPKTERMEDERIATMGKYQYVYWDFSDNEVMGLHMEEESGDAKVSHAPRKIKPRASSSHVPLKRYSESKRGNEIAFFRRYRSHQRIEKEGHGGKVMPSAILGDPKDPVIVKIAQERFGKPIPILCEKRGMLQGKEQIESITEAIKVANGDIEFKDYSVNLQKLYEEEGIRLGELQEEATLVRNVKQEENKRETEERGE